MLGPDIRWVGNESGFAGDPCWSTYTPHPPNGGASSAPGFSNYQEGENGHRNGNYWLPAECDVSIRPGWFWHESENQKVKSPQALKSLYFKSVGRGASFLLNVPPDRRGQIHEADVKALAEFKSLLDLTFSKPIKNFKTVIPSNTRAGEKLFDARNLLDNDRKSYWSTNDNVLQADIVFDFKSNVTFNTMRIREALQFGQRVDKFAIDAWQDGNWKMITSATSIGNCRLLTFETQSTKKVRLRIIEASACPCLSEFSLFTDATENH